MKNIAIRAASQGKSTRILENSAMNIVASNMVRLNVADLNIKSTQQHVHDAQASNKLQNAKMKSNFIRQSDQNQLLVGMGRGIMKKARNESADYQEPQKLRKDSYGYVGPRVKSIRKTDDNLLKKSSKFDAQYQEAVQNQAIEQ